MTTPQVIRLAVVLTVVEVFGLVRWLTLALAQAGYAAAAALYFFILVEETGRFVGIKHRFPMGNEWYTLGLGVAIETVTWIVPLATHAPLPVAIGELFVGLAIEHAVIGYVTTGTFALGRVLDFTATEALGGGIWLVAPNPVTVALLAITSILEHVQGIRQSVGLRT
jgi:hypothetical protein